MNSQPIAVLRVTGPAEPGHWVGADETGDVRWMEPPRTDLEAADEATASWVEDPSSSTGAALAAAYTPAKVLGPGVGGTAGDGTTDDTAALQAALDQAGNSTLVRTVRLAVGAYVVSRVVLRAGVTLEGDGARIIQKAGGVSSTISIPATAIGASLRGVELDGNAAAQTNNVVGVDVQARDVTIENCNLHDIKWDGISIAAGAESVHVRGNRVASTGRYGITINGTAASPARHVIVHGNHVQGSSNGALGIVGVGHFVTFSSNTTRDHGGDGIAAYNAANREISCVGNVIENPGNHGIHLGGNGLSMVGNIVRNVATGDGYFVRNHDSTTAHGSVISGNLVRGVNTRSGIRVEIASGATVNGNAVEDIAANDGVHLLECTDVAVSSNTIRNITVARGVHLLRTRRAAITGNVLRTIGNEGIYGQDQNNAVIFCEHVTVTGNMIHGTGGVGIRTVGNSNRWLASSNVIQGWTGSALTLAGANNVNANNLAG